MINITRNELCCGCNACGDVCLHGAISFYKDEEGFSYPHVDSVRCINCGLCDRVCPINQVDAIRGRMGGGKPDVCAAINRKVETRFDSTSGGLFSALAEATYENKGYVGGAVWGDNFVIIQFVSDDKEDLSKLRSSKYAQSDASGFYNAVKNAVLTGRPVLVCGTPCQMVALRAYLGKSYENLTIVDFICRGINSPLVMRKYIEMMERHHGAKVVAIKQKSKELGWHRLATKFTFEDGRVVYDPKETSLFMRGYLISNAFCRPACYECKFKGFPRPADITLADCWNAVDDLSGEFNNDTGTSLVLCNTEHGREMLDRTKSRIKIASVDFDKVLLGNRALTEPLGVSKIDRKKFFENLANLPFEDTMSFVAPIESIGRMTRLKRWLKSFFVNPLLTKKGRVIIEKAEGARLVIVRPTTIGSAPYKSSRLESRLLLRSGSSLTLKGGEISYGCDIELFRNAELTVGKDFYANIGAEIICGGSIKIGEGVILGRYVTIRDTNGGHLVNSPNYADVAPVEIGDHVWLCEGVKVLPGVKIGAGAVIAAGAVVTSNVPANTLAAGVPARVIRADVKWKR